MSSTQAPVRALVEATNLLSAGPMDYMEGLDLQRKIHGEVVTGRRSSTLLLLEHAPVFTAGKRTETHERPLTGTPVIDVDRGGKITWHGPGQLVGYPIIKLSNPTELVGYVREIERGIIEVLSEIGIDAGRVEGRSGVWIDGRRKIAAIGIRVAQGVTMHGFAINADCDLSAFAEIIPCGISDSEVTSISRELTREIDSEQLAPLVERKMLNILEGLI